MEKKEAKIALHVETLFLISGQTVFGLPPQIMVKNKIKILYIKKIKWLKTNNISIFQTINPENVEHVLKSKL